MVTNFLCLFDIAPLHRKDTDSTESLFSHLFGFFGFPNPFGGENTDSFCQTPNNKPTSI